MPPRDAFVEQVGGLVATYTGHMEAKDLRKGFGDKLLIEVAPSRDHHASLFDGSETPYKFFDLPLAEAHRWRTITNADIARNFHELSMNIFQPQVSWGTSPEMVVAIHETLPDPAAETDPVKAEGMVRAYQYLGLKPGSPYSRAQVLRLRDQLRTLLFLETTGNPTVSFAGNGDATPLAAATRTLGAVAPELADAAGLSAIESLQQGVGSSAFVVVRPPGHHAGRQQADDFGKPLRRPDFLASDRLQDIATADAG